MKKKNYIIPIIVFILFATAIPFLVNWLYLRGGNFKTIFAGTDIISYISASLGALGTISLGAITIWQNKKYKQESNKYQEILKEENNKAQERLESINNKSNELNSINTILNFENQRYNYLCDYLNRFQKICHPQNIGVECEKYDKNISTALAIIEQDCDSCFVEICHFLNINSDIQESDRGTFKFAFVSLYTYMKTTIQNGRNEGIDKIDGQKLMDYNVLFMLAKEKIINNQKEKIRKALYGGLSLDEIKALFNKDSEEEDNGQDENADGE